MEYYDPKERCRGWLVYDGVGARLAAGGCRMDADLTQDTLKALAQRMTLKQRVLGLNVDGATCGIAYDPRGPHRREVLHRFMAFLRDELRTRFSMGCDMGTRFGELEEIALELGIGSPKAAIQAAQGIPADEFRRRMDLLRVPVGVLTLGRRRAGHVVGHAALQAAQQADLDPATMSVTLQGFGNLGRAAALALLDADVRVTAVGDAFGSIVDPHGLDLGRMLEIEQQRPVHTLLPSAMRLPRGGVLDLPTDVLILAAGEDALTPQQAAVLPAKAVVVGANCGLSPNVEQLLHDRGVLVVPGFIGGIGGSASMEALFGPVRTPTAPEVLDGVAAMTRELVHDVLDASRTRGISPRQVAFDIAACAVTDPGAPPYGKSPYRLRGPAPRGRRNAPAVLLQTSKGTA
ncbi:Glu/Leu/Phe/Val dehydrogenase dimerization domain-containing protein [Streptomyces sp. NK08204]|uniref:Glu/Leu/Phe/Val dehydrogenase dimerization domain-containing protein n=1 Tax=Streptomyces sp. NK08204 TaxID=2873260 RepID=UPI001CED2035|nr:Glu/Leu/Phe/Val dehydrogenase dimerization domain-containing protein [Streptomyces sp. NK08204]